ncbi:MAG: EamA family transporter [archaeon]
MDGSFGVIFGVIAMFCWGFSDFFISKAVKGCDVFRAFFWSQIIFVLFLLPIFIFFFELPVFSLFTLALVVVSAVLGVVANLAFYRSLKEGKVSIVMPVASCWAVVTVFLSLAFLGERLALLQGFGVVLVIAGAVLVSFRWRDLLKLENHAAGVKYAVVAALAFGVDFVVIDVLVEEIGWFLPIFLTGVVMTFCLIAYSRSSGKDVSFPKGVLFFVACVAVLDALAYLSYGAGVSFEYAAIVAPIGSASPAVSIVLARILYRERVDFNQNVGIVSVLLGLVALSL